MSKRIFTALPLPAPISQSLEQLRISLPGARWIESTCMHLTLRFIGEVDGALYQRILEGLKAVQFKTFPLAVEGVGHFPPRGEPKVLYAGITPDNALENLKAKIDQILSNCGIGPDHRKYHPHITLARLKDAREERVADWLSSNSLFQLPCFEVESFELISSQLTHSGAIYRSECLYLANADLKMVDSG